VAQIQIEKLYDRCRNGEGYCKWMKKGKITFWEFKRNRISGIFWDLIEIEIVGFAV